MPRWKGGGGEVSGGGEGGSGWLSGNGNIEDLSLKEVDDIANTTIFFKYPTPRHVL